MPSIPEVIAFCALAVTIAGGIWKLSGQMQGLKSSVEGVVPALNELKEKFELYADKQHELEIRVVRLEEKVK